MQRIKFQSKGKFKCPNKVPEFLQIHFVDNRKLEIDQHYTHIQELQQETISELQCLFHNDNQLIIMFKISHIE